ncbi:MAG: hypothetical protein HOE12_12140 [Gammaproteobacteria bacterium]|nr:hypothetical protein [Gammaproteobacteria bacterium]
MKRYSKCMTFSEANERLKQARDGEWSMVEHNKELSSRTIRVSHKHWVEHSCGFQVYRILQQVWRYPSITDKSSGTPDDCPYCQVKSPRRLIEDRTDLYRRWLQKKTSNQLKFVSGQLKGTSSHTPFTALCTICNSTFHDANEVKLSKLFNGCQTCLQNSRKQQSAWSLDHSIEVVNRRGITLLDEPQNYADPVNMLSPLGNKICLSIFEVCQQYPGTLEGYSLWLDQSIHADWPLLNQGKTYSLQDRQSVETLSKEKSARELAIILGRSENLSYYHQCHGYCTAVFI